MGALHDLLSVSPHTAVLVLRKSVCSREFVRCLADSLLNVSERDRRSEAYCRR